MSEATYPELKELTLEQINKLLGAIFPDIDANNLQHAKIEEWGFHIDNSDPYLAPELRSTTLVGKIFSHPNVPDGYLTSTSPVTYWLFDKNIILTRNTVYKLGTPDPNWLVWYNEEYKTNLTMEEMLKVYHESFTKNTQANKNKT